MPAVHGICRRQADDLVTVQAADVRDVGTTQLGGADHERVEYLLEIGWRGGDDPENLAERRLLLTQDVVLVPARGDLPPGDRLALA